MMAGAELTIRDAESRDETAWRALWAEFLAFYDKALPEAVNDRTWARILDPGHPMSLRLAEVDGVPVGFSLWQTHDSSWVATPDLYLEDLFVTPAARGHGVGRALIADLVAIGKARGCARIYWMTEETNAAARKLYDAFAAPDGHIRYRAALAP
ncbi:GNAT family N-acetyltransferase [Albidovulum sediminicola]|uniref:GNAT family N-acetyltransferase n=1 Tax=Albidovulum sediminicola TaxID=2984331 RepID=A0ABT2YZD6_9RHOB|nr:GNAT family N-acetyltransferase [Defluviimonas sp. WL0075]MCV2864216.1 GNAT family N-acetyltransferase [Defluviimonas sp. WL0075]